ncbi:MAG: thioredoxin domain-containing protein [Candidatus Hydrogenedentota bacterium]
MDRNIFRVGLFTTAVVSTVAFCACSNAPSVSTTALEIQDAQEEVIQEGSLSVRQEVSEHKYTNRLAEETSPYLLQHAHNPVNWYPWGEEALSKAKAENKPIFLSVGYSSCHWCHVMEHECFEDEEVAALLNKHYIAIKVDREERPDIDEIYMAAVQAMTGQGGWPMSVFITPDLKPFWGGTYFPKESKYGRPGFMTILSSIADSWKTKREEIYASADQLTQHVSNILAAEIGGEDEPKPELITNAVATLTNAFDAVDGGFGGAPKFPASSSIAMILREYQRTGDPAQLKMATLSLDKMAQGGMYDHLGGGFARYSTDAEWLVPHFEKMLYDNAQLAQVYLEAYQVTKDPFYKRVVEETFAYILRDMRDERGGFHSAEDADSEGEEGKFYVWTKPEIEEHLGKADAKIFNTYYNIRKKGNFSSPEEYHANQNILHTPISDEAVAKILKMSTDDLIAKIDELDHKILVVRSKRVRPGLDDKVLTAWNALMITAFAQGYQVLGNEEYLDAAVEAASFLVTDMYRDGELLRTHRKGESRLPAYLDDYSFTIVALLDVYESTFDVKWIKLADELTHTMTDKFWDDTTSGFFNTSLDHKNLIVRTRTSQDNATPAGTSLATYGLLRLAKFTDNADYYDIARRILMDNYPYLAEHPQGFMRLMAAVDFYLNPPKEIAVVGPLASEEVSGLLDVARHNFVPNKIVAHLDSDDAAADEITEYLPLLANKTMIDNHATAYVCKNFACKQPVTKPEALLEQLELN